MRTSGFARRQIALLSLTLAAASGCGGFEQISTDAADAHSEQSPDAIVEFGQPDRGIKDGAVPDVLQPDLGPPPPADFPCGLDYWVKATKADAKCAPRRVMEIETKGLFVNRQVAVAVDNTGKVGIAYNNEVSSDEGQLRLVSFAVGATKAPAPEVIAGTQYDRFGVRLAMVPRGTGGFHLAYVEIGPLGSELRYVGWSGNGKPSAAEFLSSEVSTKGSVDLVEASDGKVHVVYYANIARTVYTRIRPKAGGAWAAPAAHETKLDSTVPGHGQIAVVRHAGGGPAYMLHMGSGLASQPRFRRYDTVNGWSSKKTIDNASNSGIAGQSVDLVITPTEHHAAYFAVPSGASAAQLRLASWASFNDRPQITVLEQAIPTNKGFVDYELALAVDHWGLLHLAVLLPSKVGPPGARGTLEYHRQQIVAGKKVWVKDIVDDNALSQFTGSHLALWVEENGRPHIAYYNGRTGKLMYATRDDR